MVARQEERRERRKQEHRERNRTELLAEPKDDELEDLAFHDEHTDSPTRKRGRLEVFGDVPVGDDFDDEIFNLRDGPVAGKLHFVVRIPSRNRLHG